MVGSNTSCLLAVMMALATTLPTFGSDVLHPASSTSTSISSSISTSNSSSTFTSNSSSTSSMALRSQSFYMSLPDTGRPGSA